MPLPIRSALLASLVVAPLTAQTPTAGGRNSAGVQATQPVGGGGGPFVADFEGLENGQALAGDEVSELFTLSSFGPNAGLAVFDSTPGGPNEAGPDPDLLVGTGNLLILQDNSTAWQSVPGVFDVPSDDKHGGTVRFELAAAGAPLSVDLVDADPGGGDAAVTLTDAAGAVRLYHVPAGFTGDIAIHGGAGYRTLDLQTLAAQRGFSAMATATSDPAFAADAVVSIEIACEGSMAIDRLVVSAPKCDFPQRSYRVDEPYDVQVADLDGDGAPDLVVPDFGEDAVLVFLNDGSGGFGEPTVYPVAVRPETAAIADLDGDGDRDLAVACVFVSGTEGTSESALCILLNEGDGTFAPMTEYAVPDICDSVVTADFDGDGDIDAAVGPRSQFSFDMFVFTNSGDGTFTLAQTLDSGSNPNNRRLLTADFDLDGTPDLALTKSSIAVLRVWENAGDGSFAGFDEFSVGSSCENGKVADLDADGDPDVAVAQSSAVSVLRNVPGGFQAPAVYDVPGSFGETVGLVDLDGDGDRDLVAGNNTSLTALRNNGSGVFQEWFDHSIVALPYAITGADVDGDGDQDVVLGDASSQVGAAQVLKNRGDGTLHVRVDYPSGDRPEDLAVVDVDGDGVLDAATCDYDAHTLSVLLGTGDGGLEAPAAYPCVERPLEMVSADLDGDGTPDFALASEFAEAVSILLNQGDGTFGADQPYAEPMGPYAITAGDWDADGDVDLATANFDGPFGVSVLANDGVAGFSAFSYVQVATRPLSIDSADLDGDGDPDLGVAGFSPDRVHVLSNRGDGIFVETATFEEEDTADTLVFGDWDGDGANDLAYVVTDGSAGESDLHVRLNEGDGAFGAASTFPIDYNAEGASVADVDGDLDPDVLIGNRNAGSLSFLVNDGTGAFGERRDYGCESLPTQVFAADMNGDGLMDLISSSIYDSVSVLLSECE